MQTLYIQNKILDSAPLRLCLDALRKGQIICYPTETFYALGIDLGNDDALIKLYALKRRPVEKELPLIASDITMVASVCDTGDSRFVDLAAKFWPGPLTVVLPSIDRSRTFAIRVSSHPVARQIAQAFGSPIVSTSANRGGEPPTFDPKHLPEDIKENITVLVDAGASTGGSSLYDRVAS